ncbi:hypothetical protein L0152_10540 [bacterium]|nr:hypothetical protein [bacterium]
MNRFMMRRLVILALLVSSLIACAGIRIHTDRPTFIVKTFSLDGFPPPPLEKTFEFFQDDDTGRFFTLSDEAYYWHSRDSRYEIIFQPNEDKKVDYVIIVFFDKSPRRCAEELRSWLVTAKAPNLPSLKVLLDENAPTYEATWQPHDRLIHLKAWVAENTANFKEWEGVLHLYPKEVVIISGEPTNGSNQGILQRKS